MTDTDQPHRTGTVPLQVLAGYRVINLDTPEFAPLAADGRLALAAVCTRPHEPDGDGEPVGLHILGVGDGGGGLSDNIADLAWVCAGHDREHHDGPDPAAPYETGPDLQKLYDNTTALWQAVDRLASALRMGWSTADRGAPVIAAAVARLTGPVLPPDYRWEAYARTCDPDLQLSGLGDLCAFLGGSWSETEGASSFTAGVLRLIVKGQSTPERFTAMELAFPREVTAWRVWNRMSPVPTARELYAALVEHTGKDTTDAT